MSIVYKHNEVMNNLDEGSVNGLEFEKDGKHYYIVSKEEMRSNNFNIIGMMTGVDVLTGGDYENGASIESVSDKPLDVLASFVMEHNLEGVFDYGVSNPNFTIFFFDEMFAAHEEILNPMLTAVGVDQAPKVKFEGHSKG